MAIDEDKTDKCKAGSGRGQPVRGSARPPRPELQSTTAANCSVLHFPSDIEDGIGDVVILAPSHAPPARERRIRALGDIVVPAGARAVLKIWPTDLRKMEGNLSVLRGLAPGDLWGLSIKGGSKTDEGQLAHLTALTVELRELRRLDLSGSVVADEGLARLRSLRKLRVLNLFGTRVTGAGFRWLKELASLSSLDLSWNDINRPLDGIEGLTRLRSLNLNGTYIGDDAVKNIRSLENLKWLDLGSTRITDRGVAYLSGMRGLARLNLDGIDVSPDAVYRLADALPSCDIADPYDGSRAYLRNLRRWAGKDSERERHVRIWKKRLRQRNAESL